MAHQGFEAYSPEAQDLFVSLTSYGELYPARQFALASGGPANRAMNYSRIVQDALRIYSEPEFTAEQILETALLTLRMDEATARENKENGGEYMI